jgi:hypothetical protein
VVEIINARLSIPPSMSVMSIASLKRSRRPLAVQKREHPENCGS